MSLSSPRTAQFGTEFADAPLALTLDTRLAVGVAVLIAMGRIAGDVALLGTTAVNVVEEGRDAGHREDALHGIASVHE